METLEKLEWKTVQCKINDLLPHEKNPRKISAAKQIELIQSIGKFNIVEIPARNLDGTLINYHQRLKVLKLIGRGEEIIDVRQPNRQMTEQEVKEYLLIANTHSGEWDFEILEAEFEDIKTEEFTFDIPEFNEAPEDSGTGLEHGGQDDENLKDLSDKIEQKFVVEATCVSEREQEQLFNDLTKNGYECRILTL